MQAMLLDQNVVSPLGGSIRIYIYTHAFIGIYVHIFRGGQDYGLVLGRANNPFALILKHCEPVMLDSNCRGLKILKSIFKRAGLLSEGAT